MSGSRVLGGPSLVGEALAGRYDVVALLGRGGMGEVYEARDLVLGRRVAVKIVPRAGGDEGRYIRRLGREARTAAGLTHPNIVAIHDLGTDRGLAFIVMELVVGRSLAGLLDDRAPLSPAMAASLAVQVAEALAYAHARGVVHRDISPANVMVTREGTAKVLDFGIARVGRSTPTPTASPSPSPHGTIAYLSPEQIQGNPGDARSDVYAVGCVLYEMLTGRPPFLGASASEVAAQHLHIPPQPLRRGTPPALDAIVMRCLVKEPEGRFVDARELADALGDVGAPDVPAKRPAPQPGPGPITRPVAAMPPTERLPPPRTEPLPTTTPARRRRRGIAVAVAWVAAFIALALLVVPVIRSAAWPSGPDPLPRSSRPLVAPTGVRAEGWCDGFLSARVEISWTPTSSRSADGYEVFRSDASDGRYSLVARVPGRATTSVADDARGLDTTYYYAVRAVDGERLGPLTDPVSAHTPLFCFG